MPKQGFYSQRGIPTMGFSFYVGNSTNRSDSITATDNTQTHGFSPERPFSTVDFATNQCVAGRGDKVYILEGHAESISSTVVWSPDVADVEYIGLGQGPTRPTFSTASGTSGADATVIGISGAGTKISNCIFRTGQSFGSSGVFVGISANDVTIDNCRFDHSSTAVASNTIIQVGAGIDRTTISNNEITNEGSSVGAVQAIELRSTGSTQKWTKIIHNDINGTFTRAAILGTSESTFSMCTIAFNDVNQTSTILTDTGIDIDSTKLAASLSRGPGRIIGNRVSCNSTMASTIAFQYGTFKVIDNKFVVSTGLGGNSAGIASC
jgi:hypothetical protein